MQTFWEVAECIGLDMMLEVLNGKITGGVPVACAKIIAGPKPSRPRQHLQKFYVYFRTQSSPNSNISWHFRTVSQPDEVVHFLNDIGGRGDVCDLNIVGLHLKTYIFVMVYARGRKHVIDIAGPWQWLLADDIDYAKRLLNGYGRLATPMQHPRVTMIRKNDRNEIFLFFRKGEVGQIRDNWRYTHHSDIVSIKERLTQESQPNPPEYDQHLMMAYYVDENIYGYMFHAQGFLIITRPMFLDSLRDFIRWKEARGFEVFSITADAIKDGVSGTNLRIKIKNYIQKCHASTDIVYAMLVGDSDPMSDNDLATPWSIPAGGYLVDNNQLMYTTLFYGDNSSNINYCGQHQFQGSYTVSVGVVPVRNTTELNVVLKKTMKAVPASALTMIYSFESISEMEEKRIKQIASLAPANVFFQSFIFQEDVDTTGQLSVLEAIFERQGVIAEQGHGNLDNFHIGSVTVSSEDVSRFQYINPLFITTSCYLHAFMWGEIVTESFLRCEKGPSVILAPFFPSGDSWQSEELPLRVSEVKSWTELFQGKSIGKVVTTNAANTTLTYITLFGDPSSVIFEGVTPYA